MAHEIVALIAQYGLLLVFFNVLVEQAGVPVPAVPTLVVSGALAANGRLPVAGVLAVAVLACLISDLGWYWAGRRFGAKVMRTLCRISLSADSCVRQSESRFQRWGGRALLIAKFVPGLSMMTAPLVAAMGLPLRLFVLLDGIGSLLWVAAAVGLGYAFAPQIEDLLASLSRAGGFALGLLAGLLACYVLLRWWQRWSLLRTLRMARIEVAELHQAIAAGRAPVVVDARSPAARQHDGRVIPGALLATLDGLLLVNPPIPRDRELVVYCSCPREISAALLAKALIRQGYRVRPLRGGLEAWAAAGYPTELLEAPASPRPSLKAALPHA